MSNPVPNLNMWHINGRQRDCGNFGLQSPHLVIPHHYGHPCSIELFLTVTKIGCFSGQKSLWYYPFSQTRM